MKPSVDIKRCCRNCLYYDNGCGHGIELGIATYRENDCKTFESCFGRTSRFRRGVVHEKKTYKWNDTIKTLLESDTSK